jgi:transketolase
MRDFDELETLRWELRKRCAGIIAAGGEGDADDSMSVIDALMVLYENHLDVTPETASDPDRDRFVLSKGSATAAYYTILCERGFLDYDDVRSGFLQFDSPYVGRPRVGLPGIEACTGALGHGLAVAAGIALAAKMDGRSYRTYALLGAEELADGAVWEAAGVASSLALDNLCAIVVARSPTGPPPSEARWSSFGWNVISADGNDLGELDSAMRQAAAAKGRPTAIVARATMGYGFTTTKSGIACYCELPRTEGDARPVPGRAKHEEARRNA